tara:strand:+ start:2941 stop:4764 length:1824 start_codon:yes stop_codon:yes gene_type:complete
MYNIDGNVLTSPYSLIISIFLCFGVFSLGNIIQQILIKKNFLKRYKKINYFFSPIIGTYTLIFLLYLILILEISGNLFLKIAAYFLLFLSLLCFNEIRQIIYDIKKKIYKEKNFELYSVLLIFVLLFLIAASPITHADAIDYHFSGALNILNLGHFQKEILPMNNHLASLGDLLMSLGLAVKAEQFSNLIQFLSLLAVVPFFINTKKKYFFLIFILICPITLLLISTHKPQLLFSVSSLLIFIFLTKFFSNTSSEDLKKLLPLFLVVLCINSLAKYSFHLSSFLLSFYFFYLMSKKKLLGYSIFVGILVFSFLYLPFLTFRHLHFDTGLIELLKSPLPINLYGFQSHHSLLSGGKLNIINIFFPTNILAIISTFGPLLILIFLMINDKILNYKISSFLILIFLFFVLIYGSNLQRFLFEGFLWLVFLISLIFNYKSNFYKIFSKLIYFQLLIMISVYLFFIIKIFPGSLNQNYKEKVMIENANGYQLALWVNEALSKDDILLSTHRSISLFKNKTYSDIFTWHVNLNDPETKIYLDFLKQKKINRLLIYQNNDEKNSYKNCLGKKLFFNEKAGKQVGRNPFRSSEYYNASIYEFNYEKLPDCIKNKR